MTHLSKIISQNKREDREREGEGEGSVTGVFGGTYKHLLFP